MQMQMNDKTVLTTCYGKVGESNEVWTGTGWETHSSAKVGNLTFTYSKPKKNYSGDNTKGSWSIKLHGEVHCREPKDQP